MMKNVPLNVALLLLALCSSTASAQDNEAVARDVLPEQSHWAFQPLAVFSPPNDPENWAESDIDRFIIARMREMKLKPVGLAKKQALLRRAYFDLIGLPPTPEQMQQFLADESPSAFSKVLDELLASPHYGERWGRYWMDLVHYADTGGDNADYPIPELHLYRDYIIDSLNADKPFNLFVREQIAGDILARVGAREKYAEQVVATGFIALARSYGTSPGETRHLRIEDTIETLGATFLGLSLRCARCHDHKFDPITAADYYGLYAIFSSTAYPWGGSAGFQKSKEPRVGFVPLAPPTEAAPQIDKWHEEMDRLEGEIKQAEADKSSAEKVNSLKSRLRFLRQTGLPPQMPGAYAVTDSPPATTYVQMRGNPKERGAQVKAAVPTFLAPAKAISFPADSSGRLQLADWMGDDANPLVPRVIVNRVWQHHFGRGIVGTPSNFGLSGDAPTHPELLDWLTRRFIDGGWSLKALHKLIMLSKRYRLSSQFDDENAAIDPANRGYWRFERRRLDAEALRDALMFVSGQLDLSRPGAHPFPPMSEWSWGMERPFQAVYPTRHRSVYLMTQRERRHPYLELFDGPDTNTSTATRTESNVPPQALFVMNSPFMAEAANALATRFAANDNEPRTRIRLLHEWAYSRLPSEDELARGLAYISQYIEEAKRSGVADDAANRAAWVSYSRAILAANEFRYVD